jgi:hypothetical protein
LSKKDVLPRLAEEEFDALKEVADKPMHCAISDEHRGRLIAAGYIREVRTHSGRVYALIPTRRGLKRLARANYLPDGSHTNKVSSSDNAVPKKVFGQRNIVDLNNIPFSEWE